LKNKKVLLQFFGILFLGLIPAFLLQYLWGKKDDELSLKFTYVFNLFFTLPFIVMISLFLEKLKKYIGFIFLGLGLLKIIAFLVYTKVNLIDVNRDNFLLFFVPYFVCIFAEVFVLSNYLNKTDF
jgi:hypothetical protein